MTTIKDIARISGYSIGTVSRVINDHPDVSDAAREKVKAVIDQLQYHPNTNAKNMKIKSTNIIAILVKGHANMLFAQIVEQLQNVLDDANQEVTIHYFDEDVDEVKAAASLVQEKKPKGLIFLGGGLESYDQYLSSLAIPSVLLTNSAKDLKSDFISSFTTDNEKASQEVIRLLYEKGHRRIGIVGGSAISKIALNRKMAAIKQIQEYGLPFDETMYEPSRFSLEGGYTASQNLLRRHPDLDAIYCLGDTIAIGALRLLKDMDYEVPKDISLVGFDGIDLGQYCIPRLSTIHQDIEKITIKAVDDLLLRISVPKAGVHEIVDFQIIEGKTISTRTE